MPTLAFVGFGEAGSTLAGGLRSAGIDPILAYDIAADTPDRGPRIRARAAETGTTLVASPEALASGALLILSTVTSSSALDAAWQSAPFLTSRHTWADLNSVSPALKREIGEVVTARGARFVEVAVMAPVLPHGHRVPMLVGGPSATDFVRTMTPWGMRLEVLAGDIGTAAAVKMCRSIVVKGLEAILAECVLAATPYGADGHVFASLQESYPGIDWARLADYTMNRVVVHGERRAREMEEVAGTLRAIGVEPIMAEATARRQEWAARLRLHEHFGPDGPATAREVVETVASLAHAGDTPGTPRRS
jgi:3-hydroxyisobutyrate dehydrogenase-like beta-hydroxyacid dehydrogenase